MMDLFTSMRWMIVSAQTVVFMSNPKITDRVYGNIPKYWANLVAHLLLENSSMVKLLLVIIMANIILISTWTKYSHFAK